MRASITVLLASACLLENPAYKPDASGSGAATGAATSTGAEPTGETGSTSASSTSASSESTSSGSASGESASSEGSSGSTGPAFEPRTLKAYDTAACIKGIYCANQMGDAFPAVIRAFECFRVDVDSPFVLTRVGFEVRLIVGQPTALLEVLPFDADAVAPILEPIDSRSLGVIDAPMGYQTFAVDPPIQIKFADFCVAITGGDADTSLALHTDPETEAPGDAFYTMNNGGVCDEPLQNLKDWYMTPSAHYCIDADIAPP